MSSRRDQCVGRGWTQCVEKPDDELARLKEKNVGEVELRNKPEGPRWRLRVEEMSEEEPEERKNPADGCAERRECIENERKLVSQ